MRGITILASGRKGIEKSPLLNRARGIEIGESMNNFHRKYDFSRNQLKMFDNGKLSSLLENVDPLKIRLWKVDIQVNIIDASIDFKPKNRFLRLSQSVDSLNTPKANNIKLLHISTNEPSFNVLAFANANWKSMFICHDEAEPIKYNFMHLSGKCDAIMQKSIPNKCVTQQSNTNQLIYMSNALQWPIKLFIRSWTIFEIKCSIVQFHGIYTNIHHSPQ